MGNEQLLTRPQFAERRKELWADFDGRLNRLGATIGAGFACVAIAEFLLPHGLARNVLGGSGFALIGIGFPAEVILEGRRFDRLLRRLGLMCPNCDGRLAGSGPMKGTPDFVPGALDEAVEKSGRCQHCDARVLEPTTHR